MILNGLLVELYSSISHNEILVKNLFQIRTQINFMNNMSKIFFSKMAFPATAFPINQTEIIQKHNIFIHSQIESL